MEYLNDRDRYQSIYGGKFGGPLGSRYAPLRFFFNTEVVIGVIAASAAVVLPVLFGVFTGDVPMPEFLDPDIFELILNSVAILSGVLWAKLGLNIKRFIVGFLSGQGNGQIIDKIPDGPSKTPGASEFAIGLIILSGINLFMDGFDIHFGLSLLPVEYVALYTIAYTVTTSLGDVLDIFRGSQILQGKWAMTDKPPSREPERGMSPAPAGAAA